MSLDNLFVVRHGETEANKRGVDAGPLDYPLTKKGVREASYVAKTLSRTKVNSVYCSPVHRAVQTAKILASSHKLKVKPLVDLTEAKLKPKFVGKPGRHHMLESPEAFQETHEELEERVLRAVDVIKKETSGNVIAVSHGDVIVVPLQHVAERKAGSKGYYVLHPNPGSLSIVQFTDRPRLVLFNYHRRLLD